MYTASITAVEVVAALARRRREGEISREHLAAAVARFRWHRERLFSVVELDEPIINQASTLVQAYALRSYDAVHLATALRVRDTLRRLRLDDPIFVSADVAQAAVASAEHFQVEDPNNYP